ncbi:MAG: hypothetical protein U9Q81_13890 [Pseudomonadota bacterium]|nr:hypothetical protein [Pseudomonadota bacterium]
MHPPFVVQDQPTAQDGGHGHVNQADPQHDPPLRTDQAGAELEPDDGQQQRSGRQQVLTTPRIVSVPVANHR